LEETENAQESVSVTTAVNAFEEDNTPLEIKTEQTPKFQSEVEDVTAAEEIFEESITEDNLKEKAATMKTTTNLSGIEVITEQTTYVESNEASSATTEEDSLAEDPMLERTTIKEDLEEITTTEIITTFEALPDYTTTTEYPNEEISTEQATTLNEEETSTVTEDPVEATPENMSSTDMVGSNKIAGEVTKTAEEEEDHVFITNKKSTEKTTTVKDETVEVTTPENEPRDQAFADLPPTAYSNEVSTNKSSPEQPKTSKPENLETFTTTPEEISTTEEPSITEVIPEETTTFDVEIETTTMAIDEVAAVTTDSNSKEPSINEVISEETTTFNHMERGIPSEEEVFNQDSSDVEIETTTMAFDEVTATETFTQASVAFEAKTTDTTILVTNGNEGDISTSEVEITTSATDFQTTRGQVNKQPETETTMIDLATEKLLPQEVDDIDVTQTTDDSEGVINEDTATEEITKDKTAQPIMEETTAPNALLEEDTTRNNRHEESTTTDDATTQTPSAVVMTHTYVMQDRKSGTWMETDDISNEIPVDVQPEIKDDASSRFMDLVAQNFSEADNIIFDTEEIAPVKAPEDGIAQRTTKGVTNTQDPSFLDRIQEDRIRDQETEDGTSYRTEKSISKVVTEISV